MAGERQEIVNHEVGQILQEMYLPLSGKLLEYASHEYLTLHKVLRHEPSVSPESFLPLNQDYPIIKKVYNAIARSFSDKVPDQSQTVTEISRQAWQNYFLLEARRLAMIPSFTDRLLQAVVETDPRTSAELEVEIVRFLEQEYPSKP